MSRSTPLGFMIPYAGSGLAVLAAIASAVGCGGEEVVEFGPATVVVMPEGEAVEGMTVWFQDADGEIVGEQVTAADGSATHEVPRDSMVTFFLGDDLHTVAGVQPEDVVELTSAPAREESRVVGQVVVSAAPVQDATAYLIALGCEPPEGYLTISPSGELPLREGCLEGDGTFDIVVAAVDELFVRRALGYVTDVAPDASGLTEVALEWEQDVPTIEIAYAGEQADVLTLFGEVDWVRKGLNFGYDEGTTDGAPITLKHLAGFADAVRLRVHIRWGEEHCDGGAGVVSQMTTPMPDSFVVEDADLLPRLSNATVDLSPPDRPMISWDGDTESADGIYVLFAHQDVNTAQGGTWLLALPPGTQEFRFPAVPDSLAYHLPTAGSAIDPCSTAVVSVEGNFIDGYEHFRRSYFFGYLDSFHVVEGQSVRHTTAGLRRGR